MTSAELDPPVVCAPEEVTAHWLSASLRTAVRSVRVEPIGTGQIGSCLRAYVDGDGLPDTLFIKLPTPRRGDAAAAARRVPQ